MENKILTISCEGNELTIPLNSRIIIRIGEEGIIFAQSKFLYEAIAMYSKEVKFNTSKTIVEQDPTLP